MCVITCLTIKANKKSAEILNSDHWTASLYKYLILDTNLISVNTNPSIIDMNAGLRV